MTPDLAALVATVLDDDHARTVERLTASFPWIESLPARHRVAFADEFLEVARTCTNVGDYDPLTVTINAWQATAHAYAEGIDPVGADLYPYNPDEVQHVPDPDVERAARQIVLAELDMVP